MDLANKYLQYEKWGFRWVERIGNLYHLNKARCQHKKGVLEFSKENQVLKKAILNFKKMADKEHKEIENDDPRKKILTSLFNHWEGLTVFVDNSEIPMDNNSGECTIRGPVIGRKNYYGSGSKEAAAFATIMFTIIHTLLANNINPKNWLTWFFNEYALKQDAIFSEIFRFLPWNLTEAELQSLALDQNSSQILNSS